MPWIAAAALLLAFANGANDNFKGVATLAGSRTGGYAKVLAWATATTLLGSLAALLLAGELLARFQGKGLVPESLTGDAGFLTAVAVGGGATILLATRLGLPTSTTHALVGALVGAGLARAGGVSLSALGASFLVPLLVSPLVALVGAAALQPLARRWSAAVGVQRDTCFCVGKEVVERRAELSPVLAAEHAQRLTAATGTAVSCQERYAGRLVGLEVGPALDGLHYLSAGAVSFARGLNDTPKIAALLLVAPAFGTRSALIATGVAIALGGLLAARRVARTMSFEITPMNAGQGLGANLVTAFLVLVASRFGLPVSTTHVSCGALFGLGLTRGDARLDSIRRIVLAWVLTLPLAAGLGWACAAALA